MLFYYYVFVIEILTYLYVQGYEDMYTRIKRTRRTTQRQLPRGKKLGGLVSTYCIIVLHIVLH